MSVSPAEFLDAKEFAKYDLARYDVFDGERIVALRLRHRQTGSLVPTYTYRVLENGRWVTRWPREIGPLPSGFTPVDLEGQGLPRMLRPVTTAPPPAPTAQRPAPVEQRPVAKAPRAKAKGKGTTANAQRSLDAGATEPAPTDLGNARRMVKAFGDRMRYCYPLGAWYVFDGRRWAKDESGEVERFAKATVEQLLVESVNRPDEREKWVRFALKSQEVHELRAAVTLAQSEPGVPVKADALDSDPWLLNDANGTLDLRTGELRAHRAEDLMTRLVDVDYDPAATCPRWQAFLDEIMGGNRELVTFLQRALGYSLTGSTREQCFVVLWGTGQNGKSTMLRTVSTILGDYALSTPAATLMSRDGDGGIPNDVARLHGARFVSALETERGGRLAESKIKGRTGGDRITARFLHREFFDFVPQFKLWLGTNARPEIRGADVGIWRRVRLVPFAVEFPPERRDVDLDSKLLAERAGILAWLVRGCLDWQKAGLPAPAAVVEAVEAYRADEDALGDFIRQRLAKAGGRVSVAAMTAAYRAFAEKAGDRPVSGKALTRMLEERGYRRSANRAQWLDVELRTLADGAMDQEPMETGADDSSLPF